MKLKIAVAIMFLISQAHAAESCDEKGRNGVKVEVNSSDYLTKLDSNQRYKKLYLKPKLYCDKSSLGSRDCNDWQSLEEFVIRKVKPESVICAYELRKTKVKSGIVTHEKKLVIYIERSDA